MPLHYDSLFCHWIWVIKVNMKTSVFFTPLSEKEKVEGEELQEWLKSVVAPEELISFIRGHQQHAVLQLEPSP
jgi:hypothetical protein